MDATYLQNLVAQHHYLSLTNGLVLAIADCTSTGQLTSHYCLLEKLTFNYSLSDSRCTVMVCSCDQSQEKKQRLPIISREISEDLDGFQKREESNYCIHLRTAYKLAGTEFDVHSFPSEDISDPFVDILSTSLFLAAVYDGATYGLISCTQALTMRFKCSHCRPHQSCDHISLLQDWCNSNDISEALFPHVLQPAQEPSTHTSVSFRKIPYPRPDELKEVRDILESGKQQFPLHLVPQHISDTCVQATSK